MSLANGVVSLASGFMAYVNNLPTRRRKWALRSARELCDWLDELLKEDSKYSDEEINKEIRHYHSQLKERISRIN